MKQVVRICKSAIQKACGKRKRTPIFSRAFRASVPLQERSAPFQTQAGFEDDSDRAYEIVETLLVVICKRLLVAFVQDLGHGDHFTGPVVDGNTEDGAGAVPGAKIGL